MIKTALTVMLFLVALGRLYPGERKSAPDSTPIELFNTADQRTQIRMPGSQPFHVRVEFHAFPGEELLAPGEASQILVGDGSYEESWVAPHQWRREVSLGGYRAVETESPNGRWFRASDDHEPTRLRMLVEDLLAPIPKRIVAQEYRSEMAAGWKMTKLPGKVLALTREGSSGVVEFGAVSYGFLPEGPLLFKTSSGIATTWEDYLNFAGRLVPTRITIKAGARELLQARLNIELLPVPDQSVELDPRIEKADPSQTLRPLDEFVSPPAPLHEIGSMPSAPGKLFVSSVIDRKGTPRDVELIWAQDMKGASKFLAAYRKSRLHPAKRDGIPCEISMITIFEERRSGNGGSSNLGVGISNSP